MRRDQMGGHHRILRELEVEIGQLSSHQKTLRWIMDENVVDPANPFARLPPHERNALRIGQRPSSGPTGFPGVAGTGGIGGSGGDGGRVPPPQGPAASRRGGGAGGRKPPAQENSTRTKLSELVIPGWTETWDPSKFPVGEMRKEHRAYKNRLMAYIRENGLEHLTEKGQGKADGAENARGAEGGAEEARNQETGESAAGAEQAQQNEDKMVGVENSTKEVSNEATADDVGRTETAPTVPPRPVPPSIGEGVEAWRRYQHEAAIWDAQYAPSPRLRPAATVRQSLDNDDSLDGLSSDDEMPTPTLTARQRQTNALREFGANFVFPAARSTDLTQSTTSIQDQPESEDGGVQVASERTQNTASQPVPAVLRGVSGGINIPAATAYLNEAVQPRSQAASGQLGDSVPQHVPEVEMSDRLAGKYPGDAPHDDDGIRFVMKPIRPGP